MKVYIASGNFRKVFDTDLNKKEIVIKMFLDEHVYVDERSCKDYISADKKTTVWATEDILEECYHILDESRDKDFEE
jgi:hypothetical protein